MLDEKIEPSQDTANILKTCTPVRNFPSPSVTTKFTSIPRLLLIPISREQSIPRHFQPISRQVDRGHTSPIKCSGSLFVNLGAKVAFTRVILCNEALLMDTAIGRPERSATDMSVYRCPTWFFPTLDLRFCDNENAIDETFSITTRFHGLHQSFQYPLECH